MAKPLRKQDYEKRIESARFALLFLGALTLVNIFLLAFSNDDYFITGSAIAIHIVTIGKIFTGKMGNDFYNGSWANTDFRSVEFLYGMVAIALVFGVLLVLCWLFSKKRPVFIIVGGIFILIDTIAMFFVYEFNFLTYCDLVIHALSIVMIVLAIIASIKIKKMDQQEKVLLKAIHHDHKFY